ncbi:putative MFS-type transporter [Blattamonas nauphoetae]|uniref:MFS-type transporter n=1 Tax=Blattamonas nauphoetae TaxID=2049346 RepID=A0ABQ9X8H8_9EUKA|nr:putative MFS-type transporter [Blattamonas nauphoetae]
MIEGISQTPDIPPDIPTISQVPKNPSQTIKLYKRRWYCLFLFCLNNFLQSVEVLLLCSLPQSIEQYYVGGNMTMERQNLVLSIGALFFVFAMFVMFFFEAWSDNFRQMTVISGIALVIQCTLRLFPTWVPGLRKHAFPFLLVAQMFNSLGSSFVYSCPSKMAGLWFPPNERPYAAMIASQISPLGLSLSFVVMPLLVSKADDVPIILYGTFGLQVLCLVLILVYFPAAPPTPPTLAQVELQNEKQEKIRVDREIRKQKYIEENNLVGEEAEAYQPPDPSFKDRLKAALLVFKNSLKVLGNVQFMLLSALGGFQSGTTQSWGANIVYFFVLRQQTERVGGFIASGHFFGSIVGALLTTWLSTTPLFRKRDKALLMIEFVLGIIVCIVLLFSLPLGSNATPLLNLPTWLFSFIIILFGVIVGAPYPVYFEGGAEITFPTSESISGGLNAAWYNVAYFIVPLLFSATGAGWFTAITLIFLVVSTACLVPMRFRYLRSEAEERAKKELEMSVQTAEDEQVPSQVLKSEEENAETAEPKVDEEAVCSDPQSVLPPSSEEQPEQNSSEQGIAPTIQPTSSTPPIDEDPRTPVTHPVLEPSSPTIHPEKPLSAPLPSSDEPQPSNVSISQCNNDEEDVVEGKDSNSPRLTIDSNKNSEAVDNDNEDPDSDKGLDDPDSLSDVNEDDYDEVSEDDGPRLEENEVE